MAERKPFLLRLDPALLEALQRWANDEFRSLSGQVEFLLTKVLREAGRVKGGGVSGRAPRGKGKGDERE